MPEPVRPVTLAKLAAADVADVAAEDALVAAEVAEVSADAADVAAEEALVEAELADPAAAVALAAADVVDPKTVSMYVLLTASVPLVGVPKDVILLLPIDKAPVIESPALATLVPIDVATVVAKLGSSPRAAANSSRVSRAAGDEAITFAIAVST
jgi:hypothetical protein